MKARRLALYKANPQAMLEYERARRRKRVDTPEKVQIKLNRWRKKNGLPTPTRPPPALCEKCNKPSNQNLHLDHCHETGKFRGWLCGKCNRGLGLLGDNLAGLMEMVEYLKRTML